MQKLFVILLSFFLLSVNSFGCIHSNKDDSSQSIIKKNVGIEIYTYEGDSGEKAGAMPFIKKSSELKKYARRFEYLLINVSEIFQPEHRNELNDIFNLYPNKRELKKQYLAKFINDKKLVAYFIESAQPIQQTSTEITRNYSETELMEVASKFFYCDMILPDTTVQAHVCIGLNGIKEANWDKDFVLLSAFCFEAIFTSLDDENSAVWESFVSKKQDASDKYKNEISNLDDYLIQVRLDLFERMKSDEILKSWLLSYYDLNKMNLAFRINSK